MAQFGVFTDLNNNLLPTFFSNENFVNGQGRAYFGFDDDGNNVDDNHDDMVVSAFFSSGGGQIIPEPMSLAVWGGLFGVCAIRRRRQS